MIKIRIIFVVCLTLFLSNIAQAKLGVAIGVRGSSLGIGGEITKSITEKWHIRAGFNTFTIDLDGDLEAQKVEYTGEMKLSSMSLFVDFRPWKGSFKLSGGIINNGNKIDATIVPIEEQSVGGRTFSIEDQGSVTTVFDWEPMAPYFGIGWGNPIQKGNLVGFQFDIGAMYQNSPNVEMTGKGMIAPTAAANQPLMEESFEGALVWFVVSLGISFHI